MVDVELCVRGHTECLPAVRDVLVGCGMKVTIAAPNSPRRPSPPPTPPLVVRSPSPSPSSPLFPSADSPFQQHQPSPSLHFSTSSDSDKSIPQPDKTSDETRLNSPDTDETRINSPDKTRRNNANLDQTSLIVDPDNILASSNDYTPDLFDPPSRSLSFSPELFSTPQPLPPMTQQLHCSTPRRPRHSCSYPVRTLFPPDDST